MFSVPSKKVYIYDATGVKQRKTVSTGTTTDYASNFVYENNTLQFFNTTEGYVEPTGDVNKPFQYVYQYKDHLGNIRLSYKDISLTSTPSLQIVEENNYYPFGLKHKGYNNVVASTNIAQKFKFNGVELEESLGLNLYEMDWRSYDPSLGRFSGIDLLAELSYSFNPYRFAFNNPIYWSDPLGLFESRKEARKYRRENTNVRGKIVEQKDGTFAIIDKKNGIHYEKGDDSIYSSSDKNPNDGVVQSVFIKTNEKQNDTRPRGYAIWGMKGIGGSENWGRKGVVEGSMSFTELVIPTGGGAPLLNPLVNFVRYMIGLISNVNNVKDAITPNKSTMENKVEEEVKNVPEIIVTMIRLNIAVVKPNGEIFDANLSILDSLVYTTKDSIKTIQKYDSINNAKRKKAYETWKRRH